MRATSGDEDEDGVNEHGFDLNFGVGDVGFQTEAFSAYLDALDWGASD